MGSLFHPRNFGRAALVEGCDRSFGRDACICKIWSYHSDVSEDVSCTDEMDMRVIEVI